MACGNLSRDRRTNHHVSCVAPHGVEINESKEKGEKGWRVSVSFNFIQVNKDDKVG